MKIFSSEKLSQLHHQLEVAVKESEGKLVLANSLGVEDMLLTHVIAEAFSTIDVFVLDTGRLMEESLVLLAEVQQKYPQLNFTVYTPDHHLLEEYVNTYGINAFYQDKNLRKQCCHIRKVEPLQRALTGYKGWITGLRKSQSLTRQDIALSEYDDAHQMNKYNPLTEWTTKEVWDAVKALDVPYNPLHDKHYPSIGCAPCTRAIAVGEDIRSGRWWWEHDDAQECGLHVKVSAIGQ